VENRREWFVAATQDLCGSLGYERVPKINFSSYEIEGFKLPIHLARYERVGKEYVEVPEPELWIDLDQIEQVPQRNVEYMLARVLVANAPEREKRIAWAIGVAVALPFCGLAAVVGLTVKFGWIGLLALPIIYPMFFLGVGVAMAFSSDSPESTLRAIELTGDAVTPLEIARTSLTRNDGLPHPYRLMTRIVEARDIKRVQREAAKLGYRTKSLPDA
jgi:hypothetical protein